MNTQGIQSPSSGSPDRPNLPETLITKPSNGTGHTYSIVQGKSLEAVSAKLTPSVQKVFTQLSDSLCNMEAKELPDGKLSMPDKSDDFEDCFFETCDHMTNPFDHLDQEKNEAVEDHEQAVEVYGQESSIEKQLTKVEEFAKAETKVVLSAFQELTANHINLFLEENQLINQKPSLVTQLVADRIDPRIPLPEKEALAANKELLRTLLSSEAYTRNGKALSSEEVEDLLDKFESGYHDFYQNTLLPFLQKNEQSETSDKGDKSKDRGSPLKAQPEIIPEYAPKTKTSKDDENLLGSKVLMKNIAASLAIEDDNRRAREKQKAAQEDQNEQQVKADSLVHDRIKKDSEKQDIKSKSDKENESKNSVSKGQVQKTQISRGIKEKRKVSDQPDAPPIDVIDYTKEKRPS